MLDTFNINDGSTKRSIFYGGGTNSWQTWQKPQNAKFVHFFVLGSGGGGGGGQGAGGGTARRGGGSGGSGGVMTALVPAAMIPDTLYIEVGGGGAGGSGGASPSAGGNGALTYVMIYPDTGFTATNVLFQSGDAAATGGAAGSTTGAAGVAGTVWTGTGSILIDMCLATTYAGAAGVLGQTTPVPTQTQISGITTGGGVGAGMNGATPQNGGSIIGFSQSVPTISGGTTVSQDGSGGYMSTIPNAVGSTYQQMYFTGGAGGASSNLGSGGIGGDGAFGCGGGGGGAGVTSSGGAGGRGGDGLVIITTW